MNKAEMDKPSKYDIRSALEDFKQRKINHIPGGNDVGWLKERIFDLSHEEIDPFLSANNFWNDGEEEENDYDEEGVKVKQGTKTKD